MTEFLYSRLSRIEQYIVSGENPAMTRVYAPNGKLVKVGQTVKNVQLASTLEKIANEGAETFYTGSLSQDILADLAELGAPITAEDLAQYRAIVISSLSIHMN